LRADVLLEVGLRQVC